MSPPHPSRRHWLRGSGTTVKSVPAEKVEKTEKVEKVEKAEKVKVGREEKRDKWVSGSPGKRDVLACWLPFSLSQMYTQQSKEQKRSCF